jgi:hypothetical protein
MEQRRRTHSAAARLTSKLLRQLCIEIHANLLAPAAIAVHVEQTKRRSRLFDAP